jgi:hypothetical protein
MSTHDTSGTADPPAFPWATPPSGQGELYCTWCNRDIYRPALPCSVQPIPNLLAVETRPGFGERCKWEVRTRVASAREADR